MKQLILLSLFISLALNASNVTPNQIDENARKIVFRAYNATSNIKSVDIENQLSIMAQELANRIQDCLNDTSNSEQSKEKCKIAKDALRVYSEAPFSRINSSLADQEVVAISMCNSSVEKPKLDQYHANFRAMKTLANEYATKNAISEDDLNKSIHQVAQRLHNCIYLRSKPESADQECNSVKDTLIEYEKAWNSNKAKLEKKKLEELIALKGLIWDRIIAAMD